MTATLARPTVPPVHSPARLTGPSLPALVGIEIRKSLSTRSGKALPAGSVLLAPAAVAIASVAASEPLSTMAGPIAVTGLLTAYVLMSLGVLSTAGEWTHRTAQTTFLLVPHRGTVLAAKAVAVALMGAVFAAVAAGLATGVLAVTQNASWDGAGHAIAAVVVAGAALAVAGAGVGAALGNTPAALTGMYMVILGVMPVLETVKPMWAEKVDPGNAVMNLAQGAEQTQSIAVLLGWVVVPAVAGWVLTHRRAVQ